MQEVQSDRIGDLVESAIKVESEIGTHTEEVAGRLDVDFEPIYTLGLEEGRTKPDFRATLTALKERLGYSREQLVAAEKRQIDLVKQHQEKFGRPRVAVVVRRDYDFAMTRMLEMRAEGDVTHDFMVFREVPEACEWLGIQSSAIEWP